MTNPPKMKVDEGKTNLPPTPAEVTKPRQTMGAVAAREQPESYYLHILRSGTVQQRILAIKWLAVNSNPDVSVPALAQTLRTDKEPRVLAEAAESLKYLQDTRAVPALLPLLSHRESSVRLRCADALGGIGWKHQKDYNWTSCVRALEDKALSDSDMAVRLISIYSLEKICDVHALDTLFRLRDQDPDASIRYYAREAANYIKVLNPLAEAVKKAKPKKRETSDSEFYRNTPF